MLLYAKLKLYIAVMAVTSAYTTVKKYDTHRCYSINICFVPLRIL